MLQNVEIRRGEFILHKNRPQIYTGEDKTDQVWIVYPRTALNLIKEAQENGWGVDKGLPAKVRPDGSLILRLLIGREASRDNIAAQFYVRYEWSRGTKFSLRVIRLKLRTKDSNWITVETLAEVRNYIRSNPVRRHVNSGEGVQTSKA